MLLLLENKRLVYESLLLDMDAGSLIATNMLTCFPIMPTLAGIARDLIWAKSIWSTFALTHIHFFENITTTTGV